MRRFYETATVVPDAAGFALQLDGRPVKTPARRTLTVPSAALAGAVAEEWAAQGESIEPRTMPLTGLANAALDRVAPDPVAFAQTIAVYGEADLLCYRANTPATLVARQQAVWGPLLDWARARFDVAFVVTTGIVHRPQPPETVARLASAVAAHDAFALAALSPLVTIGGSLVVALAVGEGAISPDDAFAAAHLDELWQAEQWGEDALARKAREQRARDFAAAARFRALLTARDAAAAGTSGR
jgi:chaperone required for assembly of F1-ATPase